MKMSTEDIKRIKDRCNNNLLDKKRNLFFHGSKTLFKQ